MSTRTTYALLALLVGLAAVAFFVQGPGRRDRAREHAAVFPGLVAADIGRIRVIGGASSVLLTREGGVWRLGATKEPADTAAVEALVAGIVEMRVDAVVSANVAKQSAYETDAAKGIAVRLENAAGKLLAGFVVGKSGPDFASCYLRRDAASEVLLVSRDLRGDFAQPADSWREPPNRP